MKKFLLASFAMAAMFTANADNLAIMFQGETLPNNSSIIFDEPIVEDYGQFISVTLDPELYIVSDVDAMVTVHVKSNYDIQLCTAENGQEGVCETDTDITKSEVTLKAGVPLNLLLEAVITSIDGTYPEVPDYKIEVTAWYNDDPSNVYKLNLEMEDPAAVESISANNAVTFNGKSLNYDLPSASQISIFSLSGKTVVNSTVSGTGSINLGHLAKGVYLYRVSGKNPKTAKIIIR